jgi:hypothetical protein
LALFSNRRWPIDHFTSGAPAQELLTDEMRTDPCAKVTTNTVVGIRRAGFDPPGRRPRLGGKCFIGDDRRGTLMRHFLLSALAIAALAIGMGEAPATAFLVTLTGCAHGLTTSDSCTRATAVAIASVALAADHHLRLTTGAIEQTCTALHRAFLPMSAGFQSNRERYFRVAVHRTVGGAVSGRLWRSEPVPRLSQRL